MYDITIRKEAMKINNLKYQTQRLSNILKKQNKLMYRLYEDIIELKKDLKAMKVQVKLIMKIIHRT